MIIYGRNMQRVRLVNKCWFHRQHSCSQLCHNANNSIENNSSYRNCRSAGEEIINPLSNTYVHYHVHNSIPTTYLEPAESSLQTRTIFLRSNYYHHPVYPLFLQTLSFRFGFLNQIFVSISNLLESYSGDACFESRPKHWLLWLRSFVTFLTHIITALCPAYLLVL
jgi:hypothetical protein